MKTINKLMNLEGRVSLVTGAAGYIGYAICETLAELGAEIILLDHNEELLRSKTSKLNEMFECNTLQLICNLESEDSIDTAIKTIKSKYNKIDILINCAALVGTSGLTGWATPLKEQSLDTWKRAVSVNLNGPFHLIQQSIELLENSKNASIINIGSIYGIKGMDMNLYEGLNYITPAAYATTKGGLTQLSRYLSTALAPNIRVNTITPGGIERGQTQEFKNRYSKKTPLNRMGTEEDLKGAIAYLASDLSAYVTGQNIIIDGGWSV